MKTRSRTTGSDRAGRRRDGADNGVPALGYASVDSGLALDGPEVEAQRLEIQKACQGLGLELVDLVSDHESGGGDQERPGLSRAFERIASGEASCLIVSELERLSPEVPGLARIVDRLQRGRVRLIAIDVGLDTATASGRLAVSPTSDAAPADGPPDTYPYTDEAVTTPVGKPEEAPEQVRALGYASVPGDGGDSDLGGQKEAIDARAGKLGFELVELVREREPKAGKALDRAGLSYVIERLAAGDASCLMVTGLDRLSRSVAELGTIVQWLELNGIRLVATDLDLDTASPGGHATARALSSVAGWERKRLSERTKKGLAAARAKRRAAGGPAAPDWNAIRKRIAAMRADGMTLQAIADLLNEEGVPTQRGGTEWRPSSVQTAAGYKRRTSRSTKLGDLPGGRSQDHASRPTGNPRQKDSD
jgi:DNA invertase Pin-like site-specific DNA recombinase